jgi:hypothetical protein
MTINPLDLWMSSFWTCSFYKGQFMWNHIKHHHFWEGKCVDHGLNISFLGDLFKCSFSGELINQPGWAFDPLTVPWPRGLGTGFLFLSKRIAKIINAWALGEAIPALMPSNEKWGMWRIIRIYQNIRFDKIGDWMWNIVNLDNGKISRIYSRFNRISNKDGILFRGTCKVVLCNRALLALDS